MDERNVTERLRKVIRSTLAGLNLDKAQWPVFLREQFNIFKKGDRGICEKELRLFLRSLQIFLTDQSFSRIFRVIDFDRDGRILWGDLEAIVFPELAEQASTVRVGAKAQAAHTGGKAFHSDRSRKSRQERRSIKGSSKDGKEGDGKTSPRFGFRYATSAPPSSDTLSREGAGADDNVGDDAGAEIDTGRNTAATFSSSFSGGTGVGVGAGAHARAYEQHLEQLRRGRAPSDEGGFGPSPSLGLSLGLGLDLGLGSKGDKGDKGLEVAESDGLQGAIAEGEEGEEEEGEDGMEDGGEDGEEKDESDFEPEEGSEDGPVRSLPTEESRFMNPRSLLARHRIRSMRFEADEAAGEYPQDGNESWGEPGEP
ncbi:hypothetical protein B484DRAFT_472379 [Ochromonadaceae sp. CCMP2298]|nr:hypothetical protein B484DRAFT_472379 [Ochromonadaceae sp. CCMP2298]